MANATECNRFTGSARNWVNDLWCVHWILTPITHTYVPQVAEFKEFTLDKRCELS